MFTAIQTITITLAAIALAPALAHAFEYPGKKRLPKDTYLAVQAIYYPGFTLLGFSELAAIVASFVLLLLTPPGTTEFRPTLIALFGFVGMQAVYWGSMRT